MRIARILSRLVVVALVLGLVLLGLRVAEVWRGPGLQLWHTYVPPELDVAALDATDWAGYLAAESQAFSAVATHVTDRLPPDVQTPQNRFARQARNYPGRFATDWNRSFELTPQGPVQGAVVLLHGLTDSPYSMRHLAQLYADNGFVAVVPRLPAHGTVPGALTDIAWPHWSAAVRLAMREARAQAGANGKLHLVGYSNGGALALLHTLAALEDPALGRPDRLILLAPMIGITPAARFAGLVGLPSLLPGLGAASWLDIGPEYNPFKYNSFPVNAAVQSYAVTQAVQEALTRQSGRLPDLPPILTFQSVLDFTISPEAVVNGLHMRLPQGKSELVLFDVNRRPELDFLLTPAARTALQRLLPAAPRPFTSVSILEDGQGRMTARTVAAGSREAVDAPVALAYPDGVYSLSHVGMTFPITDGLNGLTPDGKEDFGIRLGSLAVRGERGSMQVGIDVLMRTSFNPFLPYVMDRIKAEIGQPR